MTVLSPSSCSIKCEQVGFQIRALVYSHYVYSTNSGLPAAAAAAALSVWCNKQFAHLVFTGLCNVFKCRRYHCRLLLWTWKRSSLNENLKQKRGTLVLSTTHLKRSHWVQISKTAKTFQFNFAFHWRETNNEPYNKIERNVRKFLA